ncbi:MAG: hypothetical protein WBD67_10795 [Terracidiphilus sp.]
MKETIEVGDLVKVSCKDGLWTIVAARVRNLEPKYRVQLGEDAATAQWFQSDAVVLMQKNHKPGSSTSSSWLGGIPQYSGR